MDDSINSTAWVLRCLFYYDEYSRTSDVGQGKVRFHAFKIKANIKGMQTRAGMDAEELQNTEFYGAPDIKVF